MPESVKYQINIVFHSLTLHFLYLEGDNFLINAFLRVARYRFEKSDNAVWDNFEPQVYTVMFDLQPVIMTYFKIQTIRTKRFDILWILQSDVYGNLLVVIIRDMSFAYFSDGMLQFQS